MPDPVPDPTGIVDAPAPVPATDAPWPAGTASRTAFRPTPGTAGREDRDDDAGRRRRYARAVQAKGR